ncbi:LADA_0G15236g1_1 [Lachancea dasiensis]|uniref:LADA_0G15236g1_1 n=1 Tax=Lachancea dasiensis TaxID=1072105 RepID=A0A1G4JWH3_9SACH|nr:LADA_0G15236g1_1 [Lachancea dasiensis]
MRSFIKSHRKSDSLGSSPSKNYSDQELEDLSNENTVSGVQSHQNKRPGLDKQASPSLSFDSFHKLTNKNKLFSSRIFKKPGYNSSPKPGESVTTPTSPFVQSFRNLSSPENPQYSKPTRQAVSVPYSQSDNEFTPTIKGTRMHEWGVSTKERSQSVIVLNRNSTSSETSSELIDGGLGSNIKYKTGSISSATSSLIEESYRTGYDVQRGKLEDLSELQEKHPYFGLRSRSKKAQNRKAQIHSHEDLISMGKDSSLDLASFSKKLELSTKSHPDVTLLPHAELASAQPPDASANYLGLGIKSTGPFQDDVSNNSEARANSMISNGRSFEEGDEIAARSKDPENEESDVQSFSNTDRGLEEQTVSSSDYSGDESSEASSKFSFEAAGVNGRTASVKYYSRPTPKEQVYVDDLYGDEEFDEDLNCFDDDDIEDELDYQEPQEQHHIYQDNSENKSTDNDADESFCTNDKGKDSAVGRPLKGYNDLFDLSDDEVQSMQSTGDFGSAESPPDGGLDESIPYSKNQNVKNYSQMFDLSDEDSEQCHTTHQSDGSNSKRVENAHASSENSGPLSGMIREVDQADDSLTGDTTASPSTRISNANIQQPALQAPFNCSLEGTHNKSSPCFPPPLSRSGVLKYHDLNTNLDYEVPRASSDLYFIDEGEEDKYNRRKQPDDHYLDEINNLPEDYNFSDDEGYLMATSRSPGLNKTTNSFKATHSFAQKPSAAVRECQPANYKLELKDKVVTFFHSPVNELEINPLSQVSILESDVLLASPVEDWQKGPSDSVISPITPSNSLSRPSPYFSQGNSLSPIQESHASADSTPNLQ